MESWWLPLAAGLALGLALGLAWGRRRPTVDTQPGVARQVREVLSALPFGAVIVDVGATVHYANAAAHSLGMVDPTRRAVLPVAAIVESAAQAGDVRDDRVELKRGLRDTAVEAFVTAAPLDGGQFLVTAHDDTSAMASEAARREFAVNVSHELKTPIGALALMIEALDGAAEDPATVRQFSERMDREVSRLGTLVQQIIHLSRVQASSSVIEVRDVDLSEVVADAVGGTQSLTESRGIQVVTELQPVTVHGDHELLTMAARNLVENAVMYSGDSPRVVVSLQRDGDVAALAVMDHGIGISEQDRKRIFDRFFRADDARSRERGGTGLGLSIVKHVVRQHGGDVDVWSKVGVGTTVTLRLPLPKEGP